MPPPLLIADIPFSNGERYVPFGKKFCAKQNGNTNKSIAETAKGFFVSYGPLLLDFLLDYPPPPPILSRRNLITIKENYLQKNKIDNAKTIDMREYIFYSAALYLFLTVSRNFPQSMFCIRRRECDRSNPDAKDTTTPYGEVLRRTKLYAASRVRF